MFLLQVFHVPPSGVTCSSFRCYVFLLQVFRVPPSRVPCSSFRRSMFLIQVFRVFMDRLVDVADVDWLFRCMANVLESTLHETMQGLFSHLAADEGGSVTEDDLRSLIYCDFVDPKAADKNYREVRDMERLRHVVEGYLDEFNNMSKKPMNLVLFRSVAAESGEPLLNLILFRSVPAESGEPRPI